MARLGIEVGEVRCEVLVLPRLVPELGHKLEGGEAQSTVHERHLARIGRIDDNRRDARGSRRIVEADRRLARAVVVDADPGREIHQHELPARNCAIVVGLQVHAELELVSGAERRPVIAFTRAVTVRCPIPPSDVAVPNTGLPPLTIMPASGWNARIASTAVLHAGRAFGNARASHCGSCAASGAASAARTIVAVVMLLI